MQPQTYIFFGKSGSGKGTQAGLLQGYLKNQKERSVLSLETGQLFRDFTSNTDSYTASLVKEVMEKGELVPAFLPIWIWSDYVVKNLKENDDMIIDGAARKIEQSEMLDDLLRFFKREKPKVIHLKVSDDWAMERLLGRERKDDTREYIQSRLDWFETHARPSMEYFFNKPNYEVIEINGEQTVDEVHKELLSKIGLDA